MKVKLTLLLLIAVMIMSCTGAAAQPEITVEVNGTAQSYGFAPMLINNRVYVPAEEFFASIGVSTEKTADGIKAVKGDKTYVFTLDVAAAEANGEIINIDAPFLIENSTVLAPARTAAELFEALVQWENTEGIMSVNVKNTAAAGNEELVDVSAQEYKVIKVTARGNDGNVPENVLDKNYATRWSLDGSNAWLILELEKPEIIGYAGLAFYNGEERLAKFAIEISEDGENYTQVFDGRSEIGAQMSAYDCLNTKGKYIKFVGSGNTVNAWNSITEFRVYPPRPDGLMVVDNSYAAEGASAADTSSWEKAYNKLTDEQKAFYQENVEMVKNVVRWATSLYDPETGGFYYSKSAKENPDMFAPNLETTNQVIGAFKTVGILKYMPDDLREKTLKFFQDRQDPDTGYFVEPEYADLTNERQLSRNLAWGTANIPRLGGELLYKTPGERATELLEQSAASENDSDENTDPFAGLPDYMKSPEAYRAWIEGLGWETGSWTPGDVFGNSVRHIAGIPEEYAAPYWEEAIDFLYSTQDPETGLWGNGGFQQTFSGAYKISDFMVLVPKKYYPDPEHWFPNIDKYLKTVEENLETYTHDKILATRNVISTIQNIRSQIDPKWLDEHKDWLMQIMYKHMLEYQYEDGSFSSDRGTNAGNIGTGYLVCIDGTPEGCMNASNTSWKILNLFSDFYQVPVMNFGEDFANEIWSLMRQQ